MFELKMTINGKPFSESSFENEAFEVLIAELKEKIISSISEKEAAQIVIDVLGKSLEDLSININGPEDITSKINKALS